MNTLRSRFPGARPFDDDPLSRRLFFGRLQETLALRNQVLANRLTVLFARSGLGKTSLINAGITEGLIEQGMLPLPVRVNDPKAGALASIYRGIASRCSAHGIEYVPGRSESLWLYFKTVQFWHRETLLTPILILDQFEEVFTLQSAESREAFLAEFSPLVRGVPPVQAIHDGSLAVSDTPPKIRILISIREDFLANLEEFADRIPEILAERFRLLPLDRAQAADAINEPTRVDHADLVTRPFVIAPDCREAMLDFLEHRSASLGRRAATAIEPFQLQLLCQHIETVARSAQAAAPGRELIIDLNAIGGPRQMSRILRNFFRSELRAVPFFQRSKVRKLCAESLVTPAGRRVRMEESEIERLCGVKPATLKLLVDRRIVRRDQTAEGDYYELSHDSLIGPAVSARRFWMITKLVLFALSTVVAVVLLLDLLAASFLAIKEHFENQGEPLELLAAMVALAAMVLGLLAWTRWLLRHGREYLRRSRL